jgi:hypothetical protein
VKIANHGRNLSCFLFFFDEFITISCNMKAKNDEAREGFLYMP